MDAEWQIIYDKLDLIVASKADIVLSKMPVGDLATQYFADRGIFCAGRVELADTKRLTAATGAVMQTSLNDLTAEGILGTCDLFEERTVGTMKFNFFEGCPNAKTCTLILRGGAQQFIEETQRSLHDAIMIVKRCIQHQQIVGGGGAIEMELSRFLREYAKQRQDKTQIIINQFAKAFETIPRQLAENAGLDATDIVTALRQAHAKGGKWMGVDLDNDCAVDTVETFVWEPALNKKNAIAAACEAACVILSVDETIRNPKARDPTNDKLAPIPGRLQSGRPTIR